MRKLLPVSRFVRGLLAVSGGLLIAGPALQASVSHRPAGFVENVGQIEAKVKFLGASGNGAVYFTADGPILQLQRISGEEDAGSRPRRERERRGGRSVQRFAVHLRPVGANPSSRLEGIEPLPARYRFLFGEGRGAGEARVFSAVVYRDLWPGIDLTFRNDAGSLTYRFTISPGADPSLARLIYDGAGSVRETGGGYQVETPLGSLRDHRPDALNPWGSISLAPSGTGFVPSGDGQIASGLLWGSFLGGSDEDSIYSVVLDDQMRPIVTGVTTSSDFPTTLGTVETDYAGGGDVFVSQFDRDGQTLLWSTFLGGNGDDRGWVVRLDSLGRIVVGGVTNSASFPTTTGAFDATPNGGYDGFVAKLEADGSALIWSTLFGGSDREWDLSGLELDSTDAVVFSGSTRSGNLPTSAGALSSALSGVADGFVARLSADGSALMSSTYLGGDQFDAAEDLALDAGGLAVVTGWTYSTDFPVTAGAFQVDKVGTAQDAFVSKLAADGGSLLFSTFLGGSDLDTGFAIALEGTGGIVITGRTDSADFPATGGSYDTTFSGSFDAFVASLASDGGALNWATFLGGIGGTTALDVALDVWNQPVVAGWTCGDFPIAGAAYDNSFNGVCDGFVAKLSESGAALRLGSYVGGWGDDSVYSVALDDLSRPVLVGESRSPDFPVSADSYDPSHNSPGEWYDGFVVSFLTPVYCTDVDGEALTITKAVEGSCVAGTAQGLLVDVIEGDVGQLESAAIGNVQVIACDAQAVTFATASTPAPGQALFQLARTSPGGSYTDGAGTGLVGSRLPIAGDCP